jgi:hypothetical protein
LTTSNDKELPTSNRQLAKQEKQIVKWLASNNKPKTIHHKQETRNRKQEKYE